jgi:cytochrome c1
MAHQGVQIEAWVGPVVASTTPTRRALLVMVLLLVSGCSPATTTTPTPRAPARSPEPARLLPAPNVPGDPENGRRLITAKGCGNCHTVRGVPGATRVVGPNLTNVALRPTLAGEAIPNSPETMVRWIMDPPALKPGTAMPKLGLSEEEARDITAFLYSQPYNPVP